MTTYRTKSGDMLDAIAFKFYGSLNGTVEWILEANPNLADLGPVLPVGLEIELPEARTASTITTVNLWD